MAKTKTAIDIRVQIYSKMKSEGRTLSWLSDKTGLNYNTLYSCLVKKSFLLSGENLKAINDALETDFKLN